MFFLYCSGTVEESKHEPGYLEPEVFAPGASMHTVEPLDVNNISWASPLLPALPFGPLTQGSSFANAFILALGFAMIFIVIYIARRMQMFVGSTKKGYGTQVYTDQNS